MRYYIHNNYCVHWYTLMYIIYTHIIYNIYLMYNTCSNYMQNYVYDNYCVHWCTLIHIICTRYIHIYHI